MDDLNASNPLLDDDSEDEFDTTVNDADNPLLDDEDDEIVDSDSNEDSLDLTALGLGDGSFDLNNLDTGRFRHARELIDGDPMLDNDDYYSDSLPSIDDVDSHSFKGDGHEDFEVSAHSIPDFYVDVNDDEVNESLSNSSRSDYSDDYEDDYIREDEDYTVEDSSNYDGENSLGEDDSVISNTLENILDASESMASHDEDDDSPVSSDVDSILSNAFSDDLDDNFMSAYDLDEDDDDTDEFAGFNIDAIIGLGIDMGASDVHISSEDLIAYTVLGSINKVQDFGVIPAAVVQRIYTEITSHVSQSDFATDLELDTSYIVRTGKHKGRRLRLNVGKSLGNFYMVFRVVNNEIPTPADLGITGSLLDWCSLPNGLVMMNGPTGTGKTTTLASLIRQIQLTRPCKIITIERPIEFVYGTDGKALITQREVGGRDTRTFAGALTSAMRGAPDIIMLGEVRNKVEVNELLRAAETGHLAISTMHTNSAAETINRIRSLYQGDDQLRILGSLSEVVRGFANQVLVPTKDGSSRFAVREILDVDEDISQMILNADIQGIKRYQFETKQTLEHGLVQAVIDDRCTANDARLKANSIPVFNRLLEQEG